MSWRESVGSDVRNPFADSAGNIGGALYLTAALVAVVGALMATMMALPVPGDGFSGAMMALCLLVTAAVAAPLALAGMALRSWHSQQESLDWPPPRASDAVQPPRPSAWSRTAETLRGGPDDGGPDRQTRVGQGTRKRPMRAVTTIVFVWLCVAWVLLVLSGGPESVS